MCTSSDICSENLELLLDLIQQTNVSDQVKQTIVCAIGDLWRRFTNMIEDKSERIYCLLTDKSPIVRQQVLYMLA